MSTKCAPGKVLSKADKFGHNQFFVMEARKKIKTCVGALLTLLSASVVFLYIYRKTLVLLNNENPDIIFNKIFSSNYIRIDLEEKDFVVSFSVKLNGSLLKPAQIPKYIVPRGYKQSSFFMTDDDSNLVANHTLFNLSVVPCLLHRKSARLQTLAQSSPMLKTMLLSYSLCFDRNLSLADAKNASNLLTIGGGLQNMPVELLQLLFINCSKALSSACVGVQPADAVEIQVNYPQLSFSLDNSARPLSYALDSFRPLVLNPAITKNYVVYLSTISVYDRSMPFRADPLAASLSQVERVHTYPGRIPGVFATVMIRAGRTTTQVTRKYYTFLSLNSDFGSMLETITILVVFSFYYNGRRAYSSAMKKAVGQATNQEVLNPAEVERKFEITSVMRASGTQERLVVRWLLTSYQRSVLQVARILLAKHQLNVTSDRK